MGKTPDELQREIAECRSRIESKIDSLDHRVRTDVRQTGSDLASQAKERVPVRDYADKRPMTTIAGAFGIGVLLGIFTDNKRMSSAAGGIKSAGRRGGSLIDEVMSGASSTLGISVQDELRELVRQFSGKSGESHDAPATKPSPDGSENMLFGKGVETYDRADLEAPTQIGDDAMPYGMEERMRPRPFNPTRPM
jgi:ElaB/YqjD/DUF883 family membrane-anchored ribosome-binding protein